MTLQPSVMIWTIINFCLLMLVLDRLLFRPLFKVMDAREEKIGRVRRAAAEREEARIRAAAEAEERQNALAAEAERSRLERLARARAEAAEAEDRAREEGKARVAAWEKQVSEEEETLQKSVETGLDELVEAAVSKIV